MSPPEHSPLILRPFLRLWMDTRSALLLWQGKLRCPTASEEKLWGWSIQDKKKSQNLWPRQQTLDPNFAGWIDVHGLVFKARISRKENPLVLIRAVSVHSATREEKWNHFAFQMLVSRVIPLRKKTYKVLGKSSCLLIAPSTWVHHTCHNSIKKGNHKTLSSL